MDKTMCAGEVQRIVMRLDCFICDTSCHYQIKSVILVPYQISESISMLDLGHSQGVNTYFHHLNVLSQIELNES